MPQSHKRQWSLKVKRMGCILTNIGFDSGTDTGKCELEYIIWTFRSLVFSTENWI